MEIINELMTGGMAHCKKHVVYMLFRREKLNIQFLGTTFSDRPIFVA